MNKLIVASLMVTGALLAQTAPPAQAPANDTTTKTTKTTKTKKHSKKDHKKGETSNTEAKPAAK
jgi:hypothetical protein